LNASQAARTAAPISGVIRSSGIDPGAASETGAKPSAVRVST
jgi:hypothetical protein